MNDIANMTKKCYRYEIIKIRLKTKNTENREKIYAEY